ncbi:MAG: YdcF family protein [Planctomycetes bacterium]|nr:YdcF family protein [Planctomycetota bacterium]
MQSRVIHTGGVISTRSRLWYRWCRRLALATVALSLIYLLSPIALRWIGGWLDVGERLSTPVDCVYVLGGESSTRPFMAAAIYRAGYTRQILIPEGLPAVDEFLPPEHQIQREVLLARGVPRESIQLLSGSVDSTRDEARILGAFLASRPDATIAVVTSDFHTRRTRMIFRKRLPGSRDRLHFIATPTDGFGRENWWRFKDGVLWYTFEYIKLCRELFR